MFYLKIIPVYSLQGSFLCNERKWRPPRKKRIVNVSLTFGIEILAGEIDSF